ncbi:MULTISPECIES: hypothetical protein [Rhizobium]|uniref:hypothetical protein n=1 Tax=Rhizobium TaxID=379 RepID=UPI0035C8E886
MNFVRVDLTAEAGSLKAAVSGTKTSFSIPAKAALSEYIGRQVIPGNLAVVEYEVGGSHFFLGF